MTDFDTSAALATEHRNDLLREAEHSRLVALARCCKPSALRRAAGSFGGAGHAFAAWFNRGQLAAGRTYCNCW